MLLQNFWLKKYGHATIHHINECRRPPFAIDELSFRPSPDNISIYVHAKNQCIILQFEEVCSYEIFGLYQYEIF